MTTLSYRVIWAGAGLSYGVIWSAFVSYGGSSGVAPLLTLWDSDGLRGRVLARNFIKKSILDPNDQFPPKSMIPKDLAEFLTFQKVTNSPLYIEIGKCEISNVTYWGLTTVQIHATMFSYFRPAKSPLFITSLTPPEVLRLVKFGQQNT